MNILTADEQARVHEESLRVLREKGVLFQGAQAREIFAKHGARVEGEIVYFPDKLVADCLKQVPQKFKLQAINDSRSVVVGEGLLIHPPGGEVLVTDLDNGRRDPTVTDFANMQKVFQACDNIDIAGFQPISPGDVPQHVKGLHCLYESIKHSDKPWLAPMELDNVQQKQECLAMYEMVMGKDYLKTNYMTWHAVCSNSPLLYSDFACEGIIEFAKWNQPIIIVPAPMSGITSPVFMYSTIILSVAEMLAGLVLAQLVQPGVPVVPSASLTYGNLRFASWECACPDTSLMVAGMIQMFREFYKLPARAQTGITSSKQVDYQAGFETMQSLLYVAMAGVQLTSQSVGTLENLITTSMEKIIIDDEIVARVRRLLEGIDTSDESMGIDAIMETKHGGDFLTHDTTLENTRTGWQPTLSDWIDYDNWVEAGSPEIVKTANKKLKQIYAEAPDRMISAELDKDLQKYIADKT